MEATMPVEAQEIESKALPVPDQAKLIQVVDDRTYAMAGEVLLHVKDLRKQINETFDPVVAKAYAAHKAAKAAKTKIEAPLVKAEDMLKPQMGRYEEDQERKRRIEEVRLQAEARKLEEERLLAESIALEEAGEAEEAEAVISEPVKAPPVVVPRTTPKIQGVSSRENWKYRVVNPALIPREYMAVDHVRIGQIVRAMKGATNIPGIEPYAERGISAGR